jgi:flagellar hook-basal body complex protein FliE
MQLGIEAVAAVASVPALSPASTTSQIDAARATSAGDTFASLMQSQLGELDSSVGAAEVAMRDLAAGKPVELHDVMISLERARLSVQTFVQVRNKLIESYQDLMRMQL